MAFAPPAETLLEEITDFLASIPTAEQILAFKPSETLNQRLHELLDHAGEGVLTDQEQQELNEYLRVSHLLKMLKGKVRLRLSGQG
jgi:HKD family nuclease